MPTYIVNQYRKANDLASFTLSAVHGCFLQLTPMIKPTIRRGKQESKVEALILMTCKDSLDCMKKKGYYEKLILPEQNLMSDKGGIGGNLKNYHNRLV